MIGPIRGRVTATRSMNGTALLGCEVPSTPTVTICSER